ncbi:MAG TPA: hypothetical protein VLX92_00975, partial [Kofleriaceae bacterium]|nr:hypothetical protein [Kofleriaceae bacterium]
MERVALAVKRRAATAARRERNRLVDVGAATELLSREEHAADPGARLLLASCLSFERRFDDAIRIYDEVVG